MNDRARADQTHVTTKNIDELWQFVNAGDAQKAADSGRARIVLELSRTLPFVARPWLMLEHIIEDLGSIGHHGAKLEALEDPAAAADAFVREENRPAVEHDQQRHDQANRHQRT